MLSWSTLSCIGGSLHRNGTEISCRSIPASIEERQVAERDVCHAISAPGLTVRCRDFCRKPGHDA